jgi:hypothetical protein
MEFLTMDFILSKLSLFEIDLDTSSTNEEHRPRIKQVCSTVIHVALKKAGFFLSFFFLYGFTRVFEKQVIDSKSISVAFESTAIIII